VCVGGVAVCRVAESVCGAEMLFLLGRYEYGENGSCGGSDGGAV
jgi:hypothetical protein